MADFFVSQKSENLLNLALDATMKEREKSIELNVGYDSEEKEWDLIVKFSDGLEKIKAVSTSVTALLNEYAIVTIKESKISELVRLTETEYIEKPKKLFFQDNVSRNASCTELVDNPPFSLTGEGVLIAFIDSGIDYSHPAFLNSDGTTRIKNLWDQSIPGVPPKGYTMGTEYTQEQIDEALNYPPGPKREEIVPSKDVSGHGTAVAGVAAGNGAGSKGKQYKGIAPESSLIVVKMGTQRKDGFPRTIELMEGVDYAIRKALEYKMPIVVNISFGNSYGPHDGTSLVERFLDDISNYWKCVICVGSGNEGNSAGHTSGILEEGREKEIELGIQELETTVNVQIWKEYVDAMEIYVSNPAGQIAGPIKSYLGAQRFVTGDTELLIYYGEPGPYSVKQEIYIDFLPVNSYIDSGVWKIKLVPGKLVTGVYQMWLPTQSVLNVGTSFLLPNSENTLTIPSTAGRVITVGAYNAFTYSYADFSGRGTEEFTRWNDLQKPDVAAPGVNIISTTPGGGYKSYTGTSFSTPFVSGAAALLMEWGIVKKNDPYLYGEKIKAYIRKGAQKLQGYEKWPNNKLGWGSLCIRESFPM